jgi:hypothetical protein
VLIGEVRSRWPRLLFSFSCVEPRYSFGDGAIMPIHCARVIARGAPVSERVSPSLASTSGFAENGADLESQNPACPQIV